MSKLQANCPSCAGPIEFRAGSTIVVVCPFCRSAVARTDRKLEDLGKVAEIVQSKSPLKLGLRGEYNGNKFELTGRAQIRHQQGGVWDEWYATFSNGWVGWLAEAQGKFYMTFYKPLPEGVTVPDFAGLQIGQEVVEIPGETPLLVAEKGTASYIAADGEIPFKLEPNEKSNYADLTGKGGVFATIDYSTEPPFVFFGQEVTLADIGLADKRPAGREPREVSAEAMGCPNCGGTLELKAPDKTERVTCPYCSSLLDVNQGNLEYLRALDPSAAPANFVLEIGSKGSFKNFAAGTEMEIIGAVVRSVVIDGITYFWHEYLLYNPKIGFRWLVHSDNHWNFVDSVNMADIEVSAGIAGLNPSVKYNGRRYRIFQDAPATVEYVKGEFYWRVEVGEQVRAADFVSPPFMLSQELTEKESNWSLGTYVPVKEVQKAFGVSGLPKPWNVAPNQPFPNGNLIKYGFALLLVLFVTAIFTLPFTVGKTQLKQEIVLSPLTGPASPRIVESFEFDLNANQNVEISASAPVNNSWAEYSVDLISSANSDIESVVIPVEYYHGVAEGEAWSEGGTSSSATISAVPAGKYKLRVEATWEHWTRPMPVRLKVEQGVVRGVNFWLAFILLAIVPVVTLIRKLSFESKRWSESMFGS